MLNHVNPEGMDSGVGDRPDGDDRPEADSGYKDDLAPGRNERSRRRFAEVPIADSEPEEGEGCIPKNA